MKKGKEFLPQIIIFLFCLCNPVS